MVSLSMGVTIISNDDEMELWSGSCSSFGDFRIELAELIGLESYRYGIYKRENGKRYTFKKAKEDVESKGPGAVAFFMHSDYEGEWTPEECGLILNLFESLEVPEHFSFSIFRSFRTEFERFVKGLEYCNKGVNFY